MPSRLVIRQARGPVRQANRRLYTKILDDLGLAFTDEARATIEEYSGSANPGEAPAGVGEFKIDSAADVTAWKQRLTPDEIDRIYHGTEGVARHCYAPDDW